MSEASRARAASGAGRTGRTRSERILWELLRDREPGWLPEVPTGQYRLDFFCPDLRLAVEVDGAAHRGERARRYDERRDQWHLQHGIRTVRVSAREVETDPAFVLRHIDEAVGRRRLEFAIMPPTSAPIWQAPAQPAPTSAGERLPAWRLHKLTRPTGAPARSRQRRAGKSEPSWLVIAAASVAVLAFFGNWFGAQDQYFALTQRCADRIGDSLTNKLGSGQLIPRPVTGATVCPADQPSCGREVRADQVQLLADRMNMSAAVQAPPKDLRCNGTPSPVLHVTFRSGDASKMIEVLPACRVFRVDGQVRRATPGTLQQLAAASSSS